MKKTFTVDGGARCEYCGTSHAVTLFEMPEEIAEAVAEYFRDLSFHYSEYSSGRLPWPTRPKGLTNDSSEWRKCSG